MLTISTCPGLSLAVPGLVGYVSALAFQASASSRSLPPTVNHSLIESVVLPPSLKASSREEAFKEILDHMVEGDAIGKSDRDGIFKQLLAREELGSTGLGNGVAVPHVKEAPVDGLRMAVAISETGIPFGAIDGRPVHILFLVLGPCGSQPAEHLNVLRWVSGLARNGDFRRFALSADGCDGLRDLLVEMTDLQ